MKNSAIKLVEGCHYLTIREEYLNICTYFFRAKKTKNMPARWVVKTNDCAAALLNLYVNLEDAKRLTHKGTGAIKHQCSISFIEKCLLNHYAVPTIIQANECLESNGFIRIERKRESNNNNKPNVVTLNVPLINAQIAKFAGYKKRGGSNFCVFSSEHKKPNDYVIFAKNLLKNLSTLVINLNAAHSNFLQLPTKKSYNPPLIFLSENNNRNNKEKDNTHNKEGVCDSFSSSNFGKDLGTENLAVKEMDLDISTEKAQCNNVALKYSETVLNPNTTPANATLLQKAKEIGMTTRSEKFEIELLQKKEISIETALLALTNYAIELQEKNAIGTRFVSSFKNFFGEDKYSSYLAVILPTIETEAKTVTYNGKDFEVVRTAKNGQKYAAYNGDNVRVKKAMKNKADFAVTDKEGKLYDFGKDYGFEENQNRDFLKYIVEKG